MQPMTKTEAINIIKQACSSVMADLPTHSKIQSAIALIEKLIPGEPIETGNKPCGEPEV